MPCLQARFQFIHARVSGNAFLVTRDFLFDFSLLALKCCSMKKVAKAVMSNSEKRVEQGLEQFIVLLKLKSKF